MLHSGFPQLLGCTYSKSRFHNTSCAKMFQDPGCYVTTSGLVSSSAGCRTCSANVNACTATLPHRHSNSTAPSWVQSNRSTDPIHLAIQGGAHNADNSNLLCNECAKNCKGFSSFKGAATGLCVAGPQCIWASAAAIHSIKPQISADQPVARSGSCLWASTTCENNCQTATRYKLID